MRRPAVAVALVVATMLALAAPASAATAAPTAQQAQQAETACGPGGTGDALVPDRGPWFDFTSACASHDACYGAQRGQALCDTRFRDDMYAHCATRPWYQRTLCRGTANTYYEAVRRFGHLFY